MIYPFVTAMIVVRNEEKYVARCFRSLLEQDYPADRYEVLLIDGLSADCTLKCAREAAAVAVPHRCVDRTVSRLPRFRFIDNPGKILASGWNIGILEAAGEYVVRIDAHGYAMPDFISGSVKTMLGIGDAVCVGGSMKAAAADRRGEMIAAVLSSPFGVGNSKFRYSQKAAYVDTVAFGLYRRDIFDRVGLFDETLARNQDNDMHRRIREAGGRFYLNPEIQTVYHPRDSVAGMMKQGYLNGRWNIIAFRKNRGALSSRHLAPLVFVLFLIGCAAAGCREPLFFLAAGGVLLLHLLLGLLFALKKTKEIRKILLMPWIFLLLHLSYGAGSLVSVGKFCPPPR